MKILKIDDETFKVFGDGLAIESKLSPGVYTIDLVPMQGFFLKKCAPLTVTEKLYGRHMEKIKKLIEAYGRFDRSMGVIFSGDKGIGKSIAACMLCQEMMKKGLPIILVDNNYDGLSAFIDSIDQECVVLFDEFEKNFPKKNDEDESMHDQGQEKLLSLFDYLCGAHS